MYRIKTATASNAKNVAELAESSFRDTFAAYTSAEDMNKYCQSTYQESIMANEIASADSEIYVAECVGQCCGEYCGERNSRFDDRLIAYAQIKWGETPSCVASEASGEIHRLYVDKEFIGKGVAQELMARCLHQLKKRSIGTIWLGVWENNARAIAFYRKYGFKEVGSHIFPVGDDQQIDLIMVKSYV